MTSQRLLLVTRDEAVRAGVSRLVARCGEVTEVAAAGPPSRAQWCSAALVIAGSDVVPMLAEAGLPRRDQLVLVSVGDLPPATWRPALELGATAVIDLLRDEGRLVEQIDSALEGPVSAGARVGVVGGCGGAGASTLAAALAVMSASLVDTVLIDLDPLGGGLDLLLGAEQRPGIRWPDLAGASGRLAGGALGDALMRVGQVALLSSGRVPAVLPPVAVARVLAAARRRFGCVVLDLPRHPDEATVAVAHDLDLLVLVVPATVRAVASAAAVAARIGAEPAGLRLVVRDPVPRRLSSVEVGKALGLPVTAELRSEVFVARSVERGGSPNPRRRGALHEVCQTLLAESSLPRSAA